MKKIALIILNLKLKYKLIALSTITCTISIILTCTVLIFNDIKNIREWTIDEVTILAKILGEQSIPSLIFHQAHVSEQSLTSLESKSNILSACIFQDKNLFAAYNRNAERDQCPPTSPRLYKNHTDLDIIAVHLEIKNEGEVLGSILVKSNTSEVSEAIKETLWNAIITAMVSICIAYFISYLLQRIISKPINQLVITANRARAGDYSVRINHNSQDEIGQLAEDFNGMIREVQMRDSALKEANEHLEAKVEERTRKLELSLSTRQRFIDNMNHEIRTPVHNMVSIVYRLINNWNHHKSEEEIIKDLGKVLFAGRRLNALLEDILELSKVKNGQYILFVNPTRISILIKNILKEMEQAL
ncbi:MAG: HAMP domain-containing protein, partial [Rickettsiales bacterium]|nr:HAMP domain-containing protein [Rickettsiales bacterium]